MGYAIAEVCANEGAEVILVSGPVDLKISHPNIQILQVKTTQEMFEASKKHFSSCDAAIFSAAVADFTPENGYTEKIKNKKGTFNLALKATTDIAATLGQAKAEGQIMVGFALETANELSNAMEKLKQKNFDFIVLNSIRDEGAGFGFDTNKITIIDKSNIITKFELKAKKEVARDIAEKLISMLK
jgi:phosphopantothenoylcysteine decarboxylase / phosphopantothenate---cysteine ligase